MSYYFALPQTKNRIFIKRNKTLFQESNKYGLNQHILVDDFYVKKGKHNPVVSLLKPVCLQIPITTQSNLWRILAINANLQHNYKITIQS